MLVDERDMTESDGILIHSPCEGIGYQAAAAFLRLGKKVLGLVDSKEDEESLRELSLLPLPRPAPSEAFTVQAFSTFLITPNRSLASNTALKRDEIEALIESITQALTSNAQAHIIVVLPSNTSDFLIEKIFSATHKQGTLLLCPAIFGFRDGNLMDLSLKTFSENPSLLSKKLKTQQTTPMIYVGDVAAFLVSISQKNKFFAKIIRVPPTSNTLSEFQNSFLTAFRKHFPARGNWLNELRNLASPNPLDSVHIESEIEAQRSQLKSENALDLFPTSLSSLGRALEQSAAHKKRNPALDLHFPPARAL